jgi:hypothetical protein
MGRMKTIRDYIRLLLPVLTGYLALMFAYVLGDLKANQWLLILPVLMIGYAIGQAADRAENRAKGELFNIFLNALTNGRDTTIKVRQERTCCCDQEGCGCA